MISARKMFVCVVSLALAISTLMVGVSPVQAVRQKPELQLSRQMVKDVQQALKNQGYYDGSVDGIVGVRTRRGIQAYQQEKGLPATGRIDEDTVKKLGITLKEESPDKNKNALSTAGSGIKKGSVVAAKSTAKASTTAAKATAKGGTVAGKATADAATTAGKATAQGAKKAGNAVKGVFGGKKP
jgi:peptidoglycan hydrolase-like protein with peptidoglycan-binding domain